MLHQLIFEDPFSIREFFILELLQPFSALIGSDIKHYIAIIAVSEIPD